MSSGIDSVTHPSEDTRYLVIEIGGTKLQLCIGTADGAIVDRRRFLVERSGGAPAIRALIERAARELVSQWKPAAIAVGYGGPVDWHTGRIAKSYHIAGWSDFPLGEWLQDLCSLPAYVENDANVAALGEAHRGAGRGRNPVFYTTIGSGVGGGLIVDGGIYHGTHPGEVEFGHLRLDREGTITEDVCSGWSLDRIIREAIPQHPKSPLAQLCASDPGNEARHIAPALSAGDILAAGVLDTMTSHLAYALGFVVQLFHPEVIVLGGGVSLIGEPLRSELQRKLPAHIMDVYHPGPSIVLAELREDAVPVGALVLASHRSS